ncbi:MAG: hypothetical protein HC877_00620 [Thioploca sp.]|nr:hypothetical protein [Thioploca sp.]
MKTDKPISLIKARDSEYSAIPVIQLLHQSPPRRSLLRWLLSPVIWIFVIIILVFFLLTFGRQWYDSLLVRFEQNKMVHPDQSVITSGVRSQVRPTVTLVYRNSAGKAKWVIANAENYSEFVRQQITDLEQAKIALQKRIAQQLHHNLINTFATLHGRVKRFADWYFAYPTTYKILWEAMASVAQHVLSIEATQLSAAVAYDVEKYLHQHYKNIILRPELTDPQLHSVYNQMLQTAHHHYLQILSTTQIQFQTFIAQQTTHLDKPITGNTHVVLDWQSQFNKLNIAEYEKGPKGAAVGAALTLLGATVGKTIAGTTGKTLVSATGKGIATKAITTATSKGVFAKLSAPFVSKAVLVGTGGAVGTLGGPIGTILGAAGGVGIDYLLNEGIELTQRETFEADIHDVLKITQMEWEKEMLASLQEAIQIWINDTIQLLPRYKQ